MVLGAVFVTTFLVFLYYDCYLSKNLWLELFPSYYIRGIFGYFLLFGGPALLIVGILGVGRRYFKKHKNLFTALTVILVPLFFFILIILMVFFAPLTVALINN
jgi:hypothetical protein